MRGVDGKGEPGREGVEVDAVAGVVTEDLRKDGVVDNPSISLSQNEPSGIEESDRYKRDAATVHRLFKRTIIRNSVFLWLVGFINNFHYCLIMSAAASLAEGYGLKKLVALITWANIFFGIFARVLNMFIATRVSYNVRITAMALSSLLGIFFVSFAAPIGGYNNVSAFVVMLIGVVLLGTASTYGESVMLTFVQRYPDSIVGAWSSGTGISGVAASLIFLGLTSAGLTQQQTFLVTTPLCIIYWLCFMLGMVSPRKVLVATRTNGNREDIILYCPEGEEDAHICLLHERALARHDVVSVSEDYTIKMVMNIRAVSWHQSPVVHKPEPSAEEGDGLYYPCCRVICGCCSPSNGLRRWWRDVGPDLIFMHNTMAWFFFNLAVVYIAEYAAQLMAPFSFYCEPEWKDNFWVKNSYVVCQFCYQLGVLISRSSLLIVKIPYVGVISIIQVVNAVCWIVQARVMYIKSNTKSRQVGLSFILFAWMIFIGLMGGASYVNVLYLILKRSTTLREREEREAVEAYLTSKARDVSGRRYAEDTELRKKAADERAALVVAKLEGKPVSEIMPKPSQSDIASAAPQSQILGLALTQEERDAIKAIHCNLNDVWAARREMGMNIGALYATVGITLGTVVDLIFTNTMLKHSKSC
ncbi:conserved hypothetical protein [Leishmania major strain Friedlin]|uniref:CLN3 protein n=1 Tax=Leishmania major TaxID=5664 RepID=Q4QBZ3_LEIMA|nr:conserved hypothetical protein [Leishmania major strain Friedlin]XP_001683155.1 conserved hypothetical protein [Leishmania major strain Friedlin]CAG9568932.1 CLN3_protein_-_putative [Leishmania major strain Friedlin]CAG9573866.1 CLN3_protein_-_putative [Leishmania major strain Friedlin]CAJ02178.1 conserved hypothetical protein [Leishmania major strain Friedlin]CAJ03760.1 conserved hypothetical protein [Leishmania major strain Friedlin]|eukprot:XP_001680903.1 conserved hypothetical protein [Leishmania major strain Friedlin]